ncbi:MAG TPA: lipase family protein [Candidatus Dormibacteraeota bacterium]|nr:lipase family protein [Candidatus Dormibacteraeota bacterium]
MGRLALLLSLLAVGWAGVAAPADARVRTGPPGLAFYKPPHKLPGKRHGAPIWVRSLRGPAALPSASRNELILYRSAGPDGKPIAVSGTITLPKGKRPKGGWPVLTYAHGTTGIADRCAPSRVTGTTGADNLLSIYIYPVLAEWLKAGYAVLRTDYQGLGTPGTHMYLVGREEGRSVLDIVRAARSVDRRIGRRVIIDGHSQGGHAALWAAALAPRWTPELDVRGTIALAPASHIETQVRVGTQINTPSGLTGLAALIIRGVDAARPSLRIPSHLSPQARALYPQTESICLPELNAPNSFGGLAPSQLPAGGTDLTPVLSAVGASDPEHLTIKTPLFIAQGTGDTTVLKPFTDQLDEELSKRGTKIDYRVYDGQTHGTIPFASVKDSIAFAKRQLRR